MFKKILFLLLLILLTSFALFVYYQSSTKVKKIEINNKQKVEITEEFDDKNQVEENSENDSLVDESRFKNLSFKDLMNLGQNLKCSWGVEKTEISQDADAENVDEEASGGKEDGEVFFKDGDFFQEVQITENSIKTVIKTLKKGEWFYQWNSLVANQGIKMPFNRAENSEFLKINKVYNWNCEEFFEVEDVFQIPTEIRFLNF